MLRPAKTFWSKELALLQPLPLEVSKENLSCPFLLPSHQGGLVPTPLHEGTELRASHSRSRALSAPSWSPLFIWMIVAGDSGAERALRSYVSGKVSSAGSGPC